MTLLIKLNGGLGNQLFQLAFGLALADKLERELWLDTRGLEHLSFRARATERSLELDLYTDLNFLPKMGGDLSREIDTLRNSGRSPLHSLAAKIASKKISICHYKESRDEFLEAEDPKTRFDECALIYAEGYWASPIFANQAKEALKRHLQILSPLPKRLDGIEQAIKDPNSLAVHIRRGDFVSSAKNQHGVLSQKYYWKALEALAHSKRRVFFFSDDEEWCRAEFSTVAGATFVSESREEKPAQHLRLLSQASRLVLSNSSFSWWAAWLSELDGDKIIRPSLWTRSRDGAGIYPSSWSELPAE